jgi:hypothetical protein
MAISRRWANESLQNQACGQDSRTVHAVHLATLGGAEASRDGNLRLAETPTNARQFSGVFLPRIVQRAGGGFANCVNVSLVDWNYFQRAET